MKLLPQTSLPRLDGDGLRCGKIHPNYFAVFCSLPKRQKGCFYFLIPLIENWRWNMTVEKSERTNIFPPVFTDMVSLSFIFLLFCWFVRLLLLYFCFVLFSLFLFRWFNKRAFSLSSSSPQSYLNSVIRLYLFVITSYPTPDYVTCKSIFFLFAAKCFLLRAKHWKNELHDR